MLSLLTLSLLVDNNQTHTGAPFLRTIIVPGLIKSSWLWIFYSGKNGSSSDYWGVCESTRHSGECTAHLGPTESITIDSISNNARISILSSPQQQQQWECLTNFPKIFPSWKFPKLSLFAAFCVHAELTASQRTESDPKPFHFTFASCQNIFPLSSHEFETCSFDGWQFFLPLISG